VQAAGRELLHVRHPEGRAPAPRRAPLRLQPPAAEVVRLHQQPRERRISSGQLIIDRSRCNTTRVRRELLLNVKQRLAIYIQQVFGAVVFQRKGDDASQHNSHGVLGYDW
jgi:hypothetical protein